MLDTLLCLPQARMAYFEDHPPPGFLGNDYLKNIERWNEYHDWRLEDTLAIDFNTRW